MRQAVLTLAVLVLAAGEAHAAQGRDSTSGWRGLYVNACAFGDQRLESLIQLAGTTEVNALIIDLKDDTDFLTYRSSVPTAVRLVPTRRRAFFLI